MGSTVIASIGVVTALNLSHAVVRLAGYVLYERSRRATLNAVLGLTREDACQLLVHHDPVNCDVRVSYTRSSAVLPDRTTGS